jgi:hypothetical protein
VERFSPGRLFEDQLEGPTSPVYWVLAVVFGLLLIGSLYLYIIADQRFDDDRFQRRLARRLATWVGSFSGLGLASAIFALLAVPFLSKRLWLAIAIVGLLGTASYAIYYRRQRYASARFAYLERLRRERSVPRPKSGSRRRSRRR